MKTIELQVTRPMMFDGRRVEVGERVKADPLTAGLLLNTRRCTLTNPADMAAVMDAAASQADKVCRVAERSVRGFAPARLIA